ncbi:glycosyltransferase family 39 protein, partial [Patescibacteria group bacterium]|nr:glycosyltransferase family 39 protein [Patescibacteria group bacterium]
MKAAIGGYGDIPFHLTQVTKFGYGNLFDLNEPIFTGDRIRYSFFINWISGLFLKITGNLHFSVLFPAMIFAAASIVLTFLIYKKLVKKEWLALLAVLIFFLGSGFGSYYLITDKIIGESIEKNITTIVKWDAVYPQQNITWGAPLTMAFMHQRSFFLGYFLFLLFLYLLLKFQETRNKNIFYALILILGLSPLAHYHSFLAMGFITVLFAIIQLWKKDKELFKKTVLVLILAAIISLPEIIYLVSGKENIVSGENAFVKFRLGWMTDPTIGSVKYPNENPTGWEKIVAYKQFLWINFGLILPVFILDGFWLLRKRMKASKEI